jgi:uncharacterized protein HemX
MSGEQSSEKQNPDPKTTSSTPPSVVATATWTSADWLKTLIGPILGAILGVVGAFITMQARTLQLQDQVTEQQNRLERLSATKATEIREHDDRIYHLQGRLSYLEGQIGGKQKTKD